MTGVGEYRLLQRDTFLRNSLAALLSEYSRSADDFQYGLRQSSSDYGLMVVKQKYLLDAAAVIKSISVILDYQVISSAVSRFRFAACSHINNSDLEAFLKHKLILKTDWSCFLRSRLDATAKEAKRIAELSSKDLQASTYIEHSALKFLLDVVLEMPIGPWECAACFATNGNCGDCRYGQAHGICSHPESNFRTLNGSRESMLQDIRKNLTETRRTSIRENLQQEHEAHFGSGGKFEFGQREIDICEEQDLVEACD